jgi:hypothetical protein
VPLANRVTPFGALIATPERGTLMGNRGCLHDAARRIRRPFAGKRWIVCLLQFKGRRRTIMAPGQYTELFFLDEATALAAGHRPCAECQRARYRLFREHWRAPGGGTVGTVDDVDAVLHAERLDGTRGWRVYAERLARLPSGVMIADADGQARLLHDGALWPWAPAGYGVPVPIRGDAEVHVLTPPSIVAAVTRGYPVGVHPSASR